MTNIWTSRIDGVVLRVIVSFGFRRVCGLGLKWIRMIRLVVVVGILVIFRGWIFLCFLILSILLVFAFVMMSTLSIGLVLFRLSIFVIAVTIMLLSMLITVISLWLCCRGMRGYFVTAPILYNCATSLND